MLKNFTWSRVESDTAPATVEFTIPVRLVGIVLLWLFTPSLLLATSSNSEVTLNAQPRICVMPAGEQRCSIQLLVTWTSATNTNACLHLRGHPESLQCWEAQQSGTFSLAMARTDNLHMQLLDAQTHKVLSEIEIPVIKRDLRDTRRRRRHAWSVF